MGRSPPITAHAALIVPSRSGPLTLLIVPPELSRTTRCAEKQFAASMKFVARLKLRGFKSAIFPHPHQVVGPPLEVAAEAVRAEQARCRRGRQLPGVGYALGQLLG